jgi:hypothetical protein
VRSTGVAFRIEVTRSRNGARLGALAAAVPAAGLLLAAWQLASGPTLLVDGPAPLRAALAMLCACAAAWLWRRGPGRRSGIRAARARRVAGRPADGTSTLPGASLVVDDAGVPGLGSRAGEAATPQVLHASCALPGLMILRLAPHPRNPARARRRPTTLLLGRDTMTEESWRRLNVWLRWTERGRHVVPTTRPEPT